MSIPPLLLALKMEEDGHKQKKCEHPVETGKSKETVTPLKPPGMQGG